MAGVCHTRWIVVSPMMDRRYPLHECQAVLCISFIEGEECNKVVGCERHFSFKHTGLFSNSPPSPSLLSYSYSRTPLPKLPKSSHLQTYNTNENTKLTTSNNNSLVIDTLRTMVRIISLNIRHEHQIILPIQCN